MSENFLLNFKNSYIIVPLVIFFVLLLTFIDSKITGKEATINTYLKLALGSALITIFTVYINTIKGIVNEEILTGAPPF